MAQYPYEALDIEKPTGGNHVLGASLTGENLRGEGLPLGQSEATAPSFVNESSGDGSAGCWVGKRACASARLASALMIGQIKGPESDLITKKPICPFTVL